MPVREPVNILVVDDEKGVRAVLREYLELEGYRVHEVRNSIELHAHLDRHPVTLITLDISLGGEDGFVLAREIRARCNVPIIMISGRQDVTDRIVGLELGADDYITKPFELREVLARVRAVLRRYQTKAQPSAERRGFESYHFNDFDLVPQRRELKQAGGRAVELTTAEFNLLEMFVTHPARVLTRDNLMDMLKGHEWSPLDRSIDTLVGRLRKKIEPDPDKPRLIKTVRSVGYVFAADVERA